MRKLTKFTSIAAAVLLAAYAGAAAAAAIEIKSPMAMPQADTSKPGGVVMTISNKSAADDKLISVSTPAARMAQLHNAKMKHGKMRMRRTTEMDLAANGNVTFAHDGLHVMLMGLKSPLESGASFPLTLRFEKAGEVKVTVTVK